MKQSELDAIMSRNPQLTLNENNHSHNTGQAAVLECNPVSPPLGKNQDEKGAAERVHIRFISARKRLLDPDNISEKWMLDALRFAGIIQGDEPDKITLETRQRKVTKGETEHTRIDIYYGEQQPITSY